MWTFYQPLQILYNSHKVFLTGTFPCWKKPQIKHPAEADLWDRRVKHQQAAQRIPAVHNHRLCCSRGAPARKHHQNPTPRGFVVTPKGGTAGRAPLQLQGCGFVLWNQELCPESAGTSPGPGGCLQLSKGRGSCCSLGISSLLVSDPKVSLEEPFIQPGPLLPFPNKRGFTSHHERSPGTEGKKSSWKKHRGARLGAAGAGAGEERSRPLPGETSNTSLAPGMGSLGWDPQISQLGESWGALGTLQGKNQIRGKANYRTRVHQHSCGEVVPPQCSGGPQWLGSNVQFSAFSPFPAKRGSFCVHNPFRRINTFLLTHSW